MNITRKLSCWLTAGVTALVPTVSGAGSDQGPGTKERPPTRELSQVRAASTDADAGSWQMIVLTGPAQFPVAVPAQVTSLEYQSELTAIKSAQARLTTSQRKSIDYWSRGGVLRWNEILLELVARADLPPAPSPDGTYPVPDANNPFADPQFPFGNPPYAACWDTKFTYFNPRPSQLDPEIRTVIGLPTSRRTPRDTRPARRRPRRFCPTSFQAAPPPSRRRRKRPRYPGSMGVFTIDPTSKSASSTASGLAATR